MEAPAVDMFGGDDGGDYYVARSKQSNDTGHNIKKKNKKNQFGMR